MTDYSKLPTGLQNGMQRYIEKGSQVGHFLTAVLSNDLLGAVSRADSTNIKLIPEIVRWIYNEAPSNCWGDKERVQAWQGTTKEFTERRGVAEYENAIGYGKTETVIDPIRGGLYQRRS